MRISKRLIYVGHEQDINKFSVILANASLRRSLLLHSVYLQHGGGNYYRQRDVTVISCKNTHSRRTK